MFLISFLTLKFQNPLAGFYSTSALPTHCSKDLAIAVRDILVVQHHLRDTQFMY